MRLGVLDLDPATGPLFVVDLPGAAARLPASAPRRPIRSAEPLCLSGGRT